MMPYGTNIGLILTNNPGVKDKALAGTIEANIIGFEGNIKVVSKAHQFATGSKASRIIYISPYGNMKDFLVSAKRFFVGVKFKQGNFNGDHITKYVLGQLQPGSPDYTRAQQETNHAFSQGRRIVIAIANDLSDIAITIDGDQGGCIIL